MTALKKNAGTKMKMIKLNFPDKVRLFDFLKELSEDDKKKSHSAIAEQAAIALTLPVMTSHVSRLNSQYPKLGLRTHARTATPSPAQDYEELKRRIKEYAEDKAAGVLIVHTLAKHLLSLYSDLGMPCPPQLQRIIKQLTPSVTQ